MARWVGHHDTISFVEEVGIIHKLMVQMLEAVEVAHSWVPKKQDLYRAPSRGRGYMIARCWSKYDPNTTSCSLSSLALLLGAGFSSGSLLANAIGKCVTILVHNTLVCSKLEATMLC
jgi:hypothetical protein